MYTRNDYLKYYQHLTQAQLMDLANNTRAMIKGYKKHVKTTPMTAGTNMDYIIRIKRYKMKLSAVQQLLSPYDTINASLRGMTQRQVNESVDRYYNRNIK